MAKKDWKKQSKYSSSKRTTWNKGDIDVVVSDMVGRPVEDEKKRYSLLVAKVDRKGNYEHLISEWFETKPQAISYARKYMENN